MLNLHPQPQRGGLQAGPRARTAEYISDTRSPCPPGGNTTVIRPCASPGSTVLCLEGFTVPFDCAAERTRPWFACPSQSRTEEICQ